MGLRNQPAETRERESSRVKALLASTVALLLASGCASNRTFSDASTMTPPGPTDGFVEIRGQVHQPGTYPHTPEMKVVTLVTMAGGLTDYAAGVRLTRGGTKLVDRYVGMGRIRTTLKKMDMLLKAGDLVHIGHVE